MKTGYNPMRDLPNMAEYGEGDVLFLFGELFGRGYANGIVEEAKAKGMTVIGITVGRRDGDGSLRALTQDELTVAEENLGGKIINVPLEAGFDMEEMANGQSVVDVLKKAKPEEWDSVRLDLDALENARKRGAARFKDALRVALAVLMVKMVPAGKNVLAVHTMAGGIPRARVFMPILNRLFKGQGDRFLSTEAFWASDLGKLCEMSFNEVTANTFEYLIELTEDLRARNNVRYAAFGYHGCEVLIDDAYTWQSYTPYLQGWAKKRLEDVASSAWKQGIKASVYNCPEILTNSSALFLGVEVSLYPLVSALQAAGVADVIEDCRKLLADGIILEDLVAKANSYLKDPVITATRDFETWPQHNNKAQQELMLTTSAELMGANKDAKEVVSAVLSRAVFVGAGRLIFHSSWNPAAPVYWLNHDIIAKSLAPSL